jgi:hypothetical protein
MWKNIVGIVSVQLLLVLAISNLSEPTFFSSLFITAIICGFSAIFYSNIKSIRIRYFLIFFAPLYISYSLYWLLASANGSSAEYSTWELIFVASCFIVGLISSIIIYYLSARPKKSS